MRSNTLRLRSPADVVAAIPYLVGFHPTDSVVVLCCGGSDGAYAIRLDLTASDALLDHVTELITRRRPADVILSGYGPGARVTPVVERVGDRLTRDGVRLREVLRVEDGRYWSYLCTDPACCPPEGTFVDVRGSAVAAAAIAGGLVALPDREELARMIAPVGGEAMRQATDRAERRLTSWAAAIAAGGGGMTGEAAVTSGDMIPDGARPNMAPETGTADPGGTGVGGTGISGTGVGGTGVGGAGGIDRGGARVGGVGVRVSGVDTDEAGGGGPGAADVGGIDRGGARVGGADADDAAGRGPGRADVGVARAQATRGRMSRRVAEEGVRLVRLLIERARAGGDPPTDEEVAWLGVLLVNLRVRDEAWVRIDDGEIGAHIRLWRDVVRRVAEPYLPGPACLLAFAAWRAGEGALANLALDRALAADPHYSMARLLHELFVSGLPPWSVPLDITPEQLDEAS
ncbi:DUF4192 domain-containing protein [Actinoallomurus rhizosphaericola]|uniref:DUF4192 domain-containing protein n=1 Tax=Actinoallomurus rhizosphaericola TaxID=2952536 RepID=UPI002090D258|nr:DUF4192 domain-containing protein [Actinoallomurus rhizosphaericola]MCO5993789.1 DUF4192 domain-containing protein [Actinoallomurus rhizosphaericola]